MVYRQINVQAAQRIVVYALVISLTFGNLVRFQLTNSVAVYPHEFALGFIILLTLFDRLKSDSKTTLMRIIKRAFKSRSERIFLIVPWFLLIGGVSWLLNFPVFNTASLPSLLYLARWSLYALAAICLWRWKDSVDIRGLVLASCTVIAGVGLLQYVFIPDVRFLYYSGWDDHLNRLVSTLLDPGFTGMVLIFGLVLSIKKHSLPLVGLFLGTIGLTYSRASFLAAAISIIAIMVADRKLKNLVILAGLVLAILLIPKNIGGEGVKLLRTQSIINRVESNRFALQVWQQTPLFGIGFNNYRLVRANKNSLNIPDHVSAPDNSWLFIAVTTGLVGLISFVIWWGAVGVFGFKSDPVLFAIWLALTVHSQFSNSLFQPHLLLYFWLLVVSSHNQKNFANGSKSLQS